MANVVVTATKPADVRGFADGNKRVRYFDITADTGNYTSGGFTLTAVQLGMARHIDFVSISGGVATTGASGATANPIGITYNSSGASVTFWLYEGSAAGTALGQKTNAEAFEASFTIRVRVEGN